MDVISPDIVFLLIAVAALAGLIDAIAGGGGLLTVPALLWAGLTPLQSLATNKCQSVFGAFTATVHFARRGQLQVRSLLPAVVLTFGGATLGAWSVERLPNDLLQTLIPVLMIVFALYFLLSPRVSDLDTRQRLPIALFGLTVGAGVGFYDGFFGPGTGSFFVIAFVALLGYNLRRATAGAKLLNFTSNLAALLYFANSGHILWLLGLGMGVAQIGGAWLGAHLVLRHGSRVVRPLLVTISIAVSLRLLWDAAA